VVAALPTNNVILCQITSQFVRDSDAILLTADDFANGGLRSVSNVRPNCVFTASEAMIQSKVGTLTPERLHAVIEALVDILRR
jgi:mRNA interferase MazF